MAVQRLRVSYGRSGALQYLAHLDMIRLWRLLFRRAGVPIAHSEGRSPRPRISIAAALPVGVTSEGELLDIYLKRRLSGFYLLKRIEPQLLPDLHVYGTEEIGIDSPSLQSLVRESEYLVTVPFTENGGPGSPEQLEQAIDGLLEAETLPWEHRREKEVRRYDLRKQVHDLWLEETGTGEATIGMLLQTDPEASGRPEQVAAALGVGTPTAVHRSRIVLAPPSKRRGKRARN